MSHNRPFPVASRRLLLLVFAAAIALPACAGQVSSKAGVFDARKEEFRLGERSVDLTFVKPVKPRTPQYLVLYATGDAGWMGAAGAIFERMADERFTLAGYSSKQLVAPDKGSKRRVPIAEAASFIDAIIVHSRKALGLPDATPVIVTGYSRGANLVVFAAGVTSLQHNVAGAVAIALTRETDFLETPDPANRPAGVVVDEKGRIQTYPAIVRAGPIPFAVIQSKGDSYVCSEEARKLFGPDTPTRRLYEVDARNHGFSGGRDELLRDLDEALAWIEGARKPE